MPHLIFVSSVKHGRHTRIMFGDCGVTHGFQLDTSISFIVYSSVKHCNTMSNQNLNINCKILTEFRL